MNTRKRLSLAGAALWLALCLAFTLHAAAQKPAPDADVKLAATALMTRWEECIRGYKAELGLPLSEDDLHGSGLIGEPYTFITTTNGALEAKRTAANPEMAALLVEMLTEAGVKPGDTVGAGFSGSFPGLNLATLAACQAMGVRCVYIASVGASTYGANQPELTFPDMALRLWQDGELATAPALVTPGGQDDCGCDMDQDLLEGIVNRLEAGGLTVMRQPDFEANLQARMALYEEQGPITCFVGVGGNLTTTGPGEKDVGWGVIQPSKRMTEDKNSGLIQRYNARGLPVLHLLNVKRLVADYGLPYDPDRYETPGQSALYRVTAYPRLPALAGLAGAAALLWWGFRRKKTENAA